MGPVWIGIALLGLSWVYLAPLQGAADPVSGLLLVLLAVLALFAGLARETRSTQPPALAGALQSTFALVLAVMTVEALLQPLWVALFSRVHRLGALAAPLAGLISGLGLPTAGDPAAGVVGVANGQQLLGFAVNAEQLGLPLALRVLVAAAVVLLLARSGVRTWGAVLATVAGYVVLRFTTLVYLYSNILKPNEATGLKPSRLFFDSDLTLLSFLPLALVLARVLRRADPAARLLGLRLFRLPAARPAALLFLGAFAVGAGLVLVDPGVRKPGRILVDDFHSGTWEPTTEAVDVRNYGSMSTYNFTSFANFLAYHYPSVEILTRGPLTPQTLGAVDVLILKTPTRPFLPGEIEAVVSFVERGGGLWLVGDHTNLLGMGSYTNALAERFGLRFRYDACNSLSTGYFGEWRPPLIAVHPVLQRVRWFRFLTSASIEAGPRAELVMNVPDLLSDPIDYSKPSFFGDISPDPGDDFGIFPTAVAARFGRGRVLAFSDSTVLSSFSIFNDGHLEFAMAAVDFLNRRNLAGRWPNLVLVAAGSVLLALGCARLLAREPGVIVPTLVLALAAGGVGGGAAAWRTNLALYPAPEPRVDYIRIGFLTKAAGFDLAPAISRILVPAGNEYLTFFVAMQRLGTVPLILPDLEHLEEHDAVVFIHPEEGLSRGEVARLARYVERGGRLLLMLPPRPPDVAAQRLLNVFRIDYGKRAVRERFDVGPATFGKGVLATRAEPARASRLEGVANLALRPELPVEVGVKRWGRGRVVVLLGASYFSRAEMGHVMEKPDEDQMRRYRLQYFLVHDLLGLGSVQPPAVRAREIPKLADRKP